MRVFLYFFISSLCYFSLNATPIVIDGDGITTIKGDVFYFSTEDSSLSYEEVKLFEKAKFEKANIDVLNLEVSNKHHWVKFSLKNKSKKENLILNLAYPITDVASLYYEDNGKVNNQTIGDKQVFNDRKYKVPALLFDVNIPIDEEKEFFLKLTSGEQLLVPLSIGTYQQTIESQTLNDITFGIYAGIMLVMFLYNLFILISIKDISYFYYILYIITVGLVQITFPGYTFKYLWPNNLWWSEHGLLIFGALSGISIMLFMHEFLRVNVYARKASYIIFLIIVLYTIALFLALFGEYNASYNMIDGCGILLSFSALFISIYISYKGNKSAKFFLIAWSIFLVGLFAFVFRSLGLLPYNYFTNYTMPLGSAIEVTLLSLALADRINILKKEKELAKERELAALQENERIIIEQNEKLEETVELRTDELHRTLAELRQAQSQLVQVEKMASLGQLTAGIAHEINNPINFVKSNISPLKRDINDIFEIVETYQGIHEVALEQIKDKLEQAKELEEELELDFLKEEIGHLLAGITDGANRTTEIVDGLKNFSRLGESEFKSANIHEGIESTLMVLNNEIVDGEVKIEREYGDFGEINCLPGKLNQVFMNILENAIHATKQNKELDRERKLKIKTEIVDGKVEIRISDNGKGMPEKVRSQVFDPFFTTKDVGEGTGLGLSIVYSIIESHMGRISAESEEGEGTCFIISIPANLESKIDLVKQPD